jgi:hypothetical protein
VRGRTREREGLCGVREIQSVRDGLTEGCRCDA